MKKTASSVIKTLYPYLYKYRFRYILGLCFLAIVDGAQMLIPQFSKRAIDLISDGDFQIKTIIFICVSMVAIMLVISGGRFMWRYFIHGSSRRIEAELRESLFNHLLKLNWDFYEKNKIGDLMARSTNDIGAVRMAIGWGIVAGIDGVAMAGAILIIIFVQNAGVAFLAVLPLPVVTILIILFGKAVGKRFKRAQEAYSTLSDTAQETFAGLHVVKSFVKESYFIKKFAENNEDYQNASMSVVHIYGLFFPLVTFLSGLTTLIVIFVGGRNVVLGLMSAGELVALLSYIQMLIWPMLGAGFTVNMVERGLVSLKRINEVLDTEPSIKNEASVDFANSKENDAPVDAPIIEFKNFSFAYKEGQDVLKNINLKINRGSWLGIFGRTGSGKTTLIQTLPRMLDPKKGSVFVQGKDVHSYDLSALRSMFAVTPQESRLFSDTITNNIVYGLEDDYKKEDLFSIVNISVLEKDLANFKDGLDTLIGERGITLSGGQKQRITIARALIAESEILILDDSLSALDGETEKKILEGIYKMRKGKTTIIVSHRVFAFKNADFVAVLEGGCLSEYGSPSQLLSSDGYYAKTAKLQQLSL